MEKLNKKRFHFDNVYKDDPIKYGPFLIYQIGDLSCDGNYEVGEHKQSCYEITYVVSGKGKYIISGKTYDIKKGDIFLNPKGNVHNIISSIDDPIRFTYIGFDFNEESKGYSTFKLIHDFFAKIEYPLVTDHYDIENIYFSLFSEMMTHDIMVHEMIEFYIGQIIILTYRNLLHHEGKRYTTNTGIDTTKKFVYDIINFIDSDIYNINRVSKLGKELGYSYSYISQVFSKTVGLSINDYFHKRRFDKAVELIKNGNNVTEIAEKLGYNSIHSFSRAFSKYFKMSLTEYKEKFIQSGNYVFITGAGWIESATIDKTNSYNGHNSVKLHFDVDGIYPDNKWKLQVYLLSKSLYTKGNKYITFWSKATVEVGVRLVISSDWAPFYKDIIIGTQPAITSIKIADLLPSGHEGSINIDAEINNICLRFVNEANVGTVAEGHMYIGMIKFTPDDRSQILSDKDGEAKEIIIEDFDNSIAFADKLTRKE